MLIQIIITKRRSTLLRYMKKDLKARIPVEFETFTPKFYRDSESRLIKDPKRGRLSPRI